MALEDRDEIQLEAELVEIDPEEGYPQTFEIWAHVRGGLLELRADTDVRALRDHVHAFLQGLAPLAEMLAQAQGEGRPAIATDTVDFFGLEYTLKLPDGEQWLAQLFQSEDAQVPLVASFHGPGLSVDLDAGQTRTFAMELRKMADDADRLAARLDHLIARQGTREAACLGGVPAGLAV